MFSLKLTCASFDLWSLDNDVKIQTAVNKTNESPFHSLTDNKASGLHVQRASLQYKHFKFYLKCTFLSGLLFNYYYIIFCQHDWGSKEENKELDLITGTYFL